MKWSSFHATVRTLPWFDLQTLKTVFPQEHRTLPVQLSRWKRAGAVVQLRRGLYTLSEQYRSAPIHAPGVANILYEPSYLSLEWAMSWHGLIPEYAPLLTSVTPRETARFSNVFGEFVYRSLRSDLFYGYRTERISQVDVFVAPPGKALCDYLYLTPGPWTADRIRELRLDPETLPGADELESTAAAFNSSKVERAARTVARVAAEEAP